MSTERASSQRYPALDALRGVAAFAVLLYHFRLLQAADRPDGASSLFASGYLAVDFFFVLSGFVLAHAYGQRLQGAMTFRQFMVLRFIRLQPVLAIGTLLGCAVAIGQRVSGTDGAAGYFAIATSLPLNLMMLPNLLVPHGIFLFNPPAWSVFYEMVANAIYAAGIRGSNASSNPASIAWASGIVCALGLIGVIATICLKGSLDYGVVRGDWPIATARIAFSFPLGILLYLARRYWIGRIRQVSLIWLLPPCLILLAPDFHGFLRALYDLAFVAGLSPMLVLLGARVEAKGEVLALAKWLGLVSYPLYAVHAPIKHMVETWSSLAFLPMLLLATTASVTIAWLVGAFLDPRLRRRLVEFCCKSDAGTSRPFTQPTATHF